MGMVFVAFEKDGTNNQPNGGGVATSLSCPVDGVYLAVLVVFVGDTKFSLEVITDILEGASLN